MIRISGRRGEYEQENTNGSVCVSRDANEKESGNACCYESVQYCLTDSTVPQARGYSRKDSIHQFAPVRGGLLYQKLLSDVGSLAI